MYMPPGRRDVTLQKESLLYSRSLILKQAGDHMSMNPAFNVRAEIGQQKPTILLEYLKKIKKKYPRAKSLLYA